MRAIKQDADRFINDLEAQYFSYEFIDPKTNQKIKGAVQLGVRVWGGFYEIVFPESCYEEVMNMIGRLDWPSNFKQKSSFKVLRKFLGATDIIPFKETPLARITWRTTHPDIRIYPIGIKKDEYKDGVEQL